MAEPANEKQKILPESVQCVVIGEIGVDFAKSLVSDSRRTPVIGDEEALVQVLAVGINPSDVKATRGAFPWVQPGNICARDCAGRVVAGPSDLVGKIVWSSAGKERGLIGDGNLTEYTKLPVRACLPLPHGVGVAEAGSMGVPLCTAATILSKLNIEKGETVAVTGGNGQVARFVMGLAKWKGATTIGIARRDAPLQYADHAIVGTVDESIVKRLTGIASINAIVDTVGIGTEHLVEALTHHGRIVILSSPEPDTCFPLCIRSFYRRDLTLHSCETMQYSAVQSADIVRDVLPAFVDGALTPPELHDDMFTLDRVREAYELMTHGQWLFQASTGRPKWPRSS